MLNPDERERSRSRTICGFIRSWTSSPHWLQMAVEALAKMGMLQLE